MEYEFTLKYRLDPQDGADQDTIVERLGAAGCTDALVGLGVAGHLGLEFAREAASAEEAILSALADVKRAMAGAKLIEAGPDLVGLTDVADLVGMSRQNMRKLMVTHAASFPAPVHAGSTSIWHLALVLGFLVERQQHGLEPSMLEVARAAMRVNIAKEAALVGFRPEDSRFALAA
ncbi:DNA-binding protein [Sphaerotilus sp.]|uniref:helix-turn-helix transcriptional regulator n=1 Tax=Sphaerotilus sp. TaxID=2093942 RepID=UPI002ACEE842|nr:DNA-binding protein [Sphaerotilus sp.]MDZ7856722.1 DNA-binding protein [Sphaerotilus sp.]